MIYLEVMSKQFYMMGLTAKKTLSATSNYSEKDSPCVINEPKSWDCILTIPLEILSMFFLIPFKLKWDEVSRIYVVNSSISRKLISGALYLFHFGFKLGTILNEVLKSSNWSSSQTKNLFNTARTLTSTLLFFPTILPWLCSQHFAHLATELRSFSLSPGKRGIAISYILAVYPITSTILSFNIDKNHYMNILPENDSIRSVASLVFFMTRPLEFFFEDFACLLMTCVFLKAKDFQRKVKESSIQGCQECIDSLKDFLSHCNDNLYVGSLMLFNFVDCIVSYSQHFTTVLKNGVGNLKDNIGVAELELVILFLCGVAWFLGAEANRLIHDTISEWLNKKQVNPNVNTNERLRLLGIGQEFSKSLGVKCRFFTITYGTISSMFGLLMTYAVIGMGSTSK